MGGNDMPPIAKKFVMDADTIVCHGKPEKEDIHYASKSTNRRLERISVKTDTDSAERALAEAYDTTPYAGSPYCHTHPSLLAAYGSLYGLSPPNPDDCRVLELGCADGGNLIPIAYDLPDSQFIGIDFSAVQIRPIDALEKLDQLYAGIPAKQLCYRLPGGFNNVTVVLL